MYGIVLFSSGKYLKINIMNLIFYKLKVCFIFVFKLFFFF